MKQLQEENDELKAQLEKLHQLITPHVVNLIKEGISCNYGGSSYETQIECVFIPIMKEFENGTYKRLNTVKADAFREGFEMSSQGFNAEHGADVDTVVREYLLNIELSNSK